MKELIQIINQLHTINEQVVEKDNLIDHMQMVISLVSKMVSDSLLIKSDIYLDLRAKYLNQIEERLQKISQSSVTIEPENIKTCPDKALSLNEKGMKQKSFTKDDISAPIRTDIFQAPGCRRSFARKKDTPSDKSGDKSGDTSGDKPCDKPCGDQSTGKTLLEQEENKYISFDYQDNRYYLNLKKHDNQYDIYDDQLKITGNLVGNNLTLLAEGKDGSLESKNIQLKTLLQDEINGPNGPQELFDSYWLQNIS